MRKKNLLFGVNSKCRQCTKECKKYEQQTVVLCKYFDSVTAKKKRL